MFLDVSLILVIFVFVMVCRNVWIAGWYLFALFGRDRWYLDLTTESKMVYKNVISNSNSVEYNVCKILNGFG